VGAILVCSQPLLGNHLAIPGYADIYVSVLSVALLYGALEVFHFRGLAVWVALILVPILVTLVLMKNAGWVIALQAFASILFLMMIKKWTTTAPNPVLILNTIGVFCIGCVVLILLAAFAELSLHIGGRVLTFSTNAIYQIPWSVMQALLINSSFSVLFISFWVVTFAARSVTLSDREVLLIIFVLLHLVVNFAIMATDYGLRTTSENSDLGGSRFLITFSVAALLYVVAVAGRLKHFNGVSV